MPSFATLGPASVRRWIWLPAAVCLVVAPRVISARADQGAGGTAPQGKDFRK
jgi:hypothetical protein